MKRFLILFILSLLLPIVPQDGKAAEPIRVIVDGQTISFADVQPELINGRVLLPLRGLFEAMDATVKWDPANRTISSEKFRSYENMKVTMNTHSLFVWKNYTVRGIGVTEKTNKVMKIDQAPFIYQNRTLIPLRAAGESFGYYVYWDQKNKIVTLKKSNSLKKSFGTFAEYPYIPSTAYAYTPKPAEFDVFFRTNKKRKENGQEPLVLNEDLSYVAAKKSQDLHDKDYFDHESPTYGSPFKMMETFGISYTMAGENIAAGFSDANVVVNAWMDSPGHRRNMLNSGFKEIGVGFVYEDDGYQTYWTQMFRTK